MPRIERDRELARRRKRKAKLKKLEARFAKLTAAGEKQVVFEKLRKISPLVNWEERLAGEAK